MLLLLLAQCWRVRVDHRPPIPTLPGKQQCRLSDCWSFSQVQMEALTRVCIHVDAVSFILTPNSARA
jgi:hypothetical protein